MKILFVCHGNICRSPMAEFVMKRLLKKTGVAADGGQGAGVRHPCRLHGAAERIATGGVSVVSYG